MKKIEPLEINLSILNSIFTEKLIGFKKDKNIIIWSNDNFSELFVSQDKHIYKISNLKQIEKQKLLQLQTIKK